MVLKGNLSQRRLFIVEPTFVLKVGHVSECTRVFAHQAKVLGFEVTILVPENAPTGTPVESEFELIRILPNTYDSFLIEGLKYRYRFRFLILAFSLVFSKNLRRKFVFFFDRLNWYLEYQFKTTQTWHKLNSTYTFVEHDRFIFPNADLLTSKSLLKYLKSNFSKKLPSIGLRFINVMENNGIPKLQNANSLFKLLQKYQLKKFQITVTAETESYRAYIGQFVTAVGICEYPHNLKISLRRNRTKPKKSLVIGSLGSARPDKGFQTLGSLIPKLSASRDKDMSFLVQEATQSWGYEYDSTLAALRNYEQIEFLPGFLTLDEMHNSINACDVLLMPYDKSVYEFRGSAMLFEAADLGIPMLVPSGTGLGEVVRKYGIGATFTGEADILMALKILLRIDPKILRSRFATYNSQRQKNFEKLIIG